MAGAIKSETTCSCSAALILIVTFARAVRGLRALSVTCTSNTIVLFAVTLIVLFAVSFPVVEPIANNPSEFPEIIEYLSSCPASGSDALTWQIKSFKTFAVLISKFWSDITGL